MMTVKEIKETIETMIPSALQEEWDNSGLLIGFEDRDVKNILLCLEIDGAVAEEAIAKGAELIITHHPLIFGGLQSLNTADPMTEPIIRLIQNGISVYSSHTPFDKIDGGNNDALAGLLGLMSIRDLAGERVPSAEDMIQAPSELHVGRTGAFKKAKYFHEVIELVCEELGLSRSEIRAVGDPDTLIRKVGLCTGAGAEFIAQAASMGCDLFITGDLKYHQAQEAKALGVCVIDAGHYGTEKIFPAVMDIQLEKVIDQDVNILISECDLNPFMTL